MNRKIHSPHPFKTLLAIGLLALLTLSARAATYDDVTWAPYDILYDDGGNPYAYWNDPANWTSGVVPTLQNTNDGHYYAVHFADSAGAIVPCIVTNDTQCGRLVIGDYGGAGELILTNGASFQAGFVDGYWTGVGFPNGPGTLYVGPGCNASFGSHLWVGNGTNDNGTTNTGTVIVDGGTISIPNGQLGVGWNGSGGTNFLTLTNGGKVFLTAWTGSTLGYPGNSGGGIGILDLGDNGCSVVVTNNQTGFFSTLVASDQLTAYEGQGTVTWSYNPTLNITTINAVAPVNPNTPVITGQPTNEIVSLGGAASFHVTISNASCNYQWLFNNTPLADGSGISGSKTATLTITGVNAANVGNYSVLATNQSTPDFTQSSVASLTAEGINLYPVVTINGVPGNTYVVQYATSLTPPVAWTNLGTYTLGGFTQYIVDTNSPMGVTRFYQVIQQ